MSIFKPRIWLLGPLVLLLVGSYTVATAYAGGPYFYHRAIEGTGKGVKISAKSPETIEGVGGEQRLTSGTVELTSAQVKTKGIIYNNINQGQAKLELTYAEPRLVGA